MLDEFVETWATSLTILLVVYTRDGEALSFCILLGRQIRLGLLLPLLDFL